MHSSILLGTLLALAALIFAGDPCTGQVGTSADRKVAIVIDSSGSNLDTDPSNLRLVAGQAVVDNLGGTDHVAVIDFDFSAVVVSPLSPPAAASFDGIDSDGGTYIAKGVELALTELVGAPSNSAGIIVLTDGEDYYVQDLVDQINAAAALGIRVSFGFLNPLGSPQNPDILGAILASGGVYANIDTAESQANFVSLVLASGIVHNDSAGGNGQTLLLLGLRVSGNVSASTSPSTFQYEALANEVLGFNITAITAGVAFDITLKQKGGAEISTTSTDATTGLGTIDYTAGGSDESLELDVSTTNATGGLFAVAVTSNLNRIINVCGSNPNPGTGGNNR